MLEYAAAAPTPPEKCPAPHPVTLLLMLHGINLPFSHLSTCHHCSHMTPQGCHAHTDRPGRLQDCSPRFEASQSRQQNQCAQAVEGDIPESKDQSKELTQNRHIETA